MVEILQAGVLRLHKKLRILSTPQGEINISPMETRILTVLMESNGDGVSRAELMRTVWQTEYVDDTRTLDVHICYLRKKLDKIGLRDIVATVHNYGFAIRQPN